MRAALRGPVSTNLYRLSSSRCLSNACLQDPFLRIHAGQYHSASHPSPSLPYSSAEREILAAAAHHVPAHGFTQQSLARGAESAGYLPASLALLPRGPFELVMYHLISQRQALKKQLPWHGSIDEIDLPDPAKELRSRLRHALLTRLHGNSSVIQHYSGALALMSLARNIPPSLTELARLSDEILYLAGDTSVDTTWYLKRGAIAGVYVASETFMTQDQSSNFKDTEKFLDRRLEDMRVLGQGAADVGQFVGFAGISTVNILRSWNVRI